VKSLEYIPLPFFEDNYAWLITDGTHVIVVDPGEAAPVIRYCEARQLRLSGVLLTHHHTDHTGGVANLLDSSSNHAVPVFGPATEPIFGVTTRVGDGYRVELAEPHSFGRRSRTTHRIFSVAIRSSLAVADDCSREQRNRCFAHLTSSQTCPRLLSSIVRTNTPSQIFGSQWLVNQEIET
jgi:ribonuclease BN (tRNA processing enzyme)